jgi:hypothetical protein
MLHNILLELVAILTWSSVLGQYDIETLVTTVQSIYSDIDTFEAEDDQTIYIDTIYPTADVQTCNHKNTNNCNNNISSEAK